MPPSDTEKARSAQGSNTPLLRAAITIFLLTVTLPYLCLFLHLYSNLLPSWSNPLTALSTWQAGHKTHTRPSSAPQSNDDNSFEPLKRYSLDYNKVACWQDSGVWIKHLDPIELAHLGIDRFRSKERATNQTDEDAFCERLRLHGASFWELPPPWPYPGTPCATIDLCVDPTKEVSVEVGFPSMGGVYALGTKMGLGVNGWQALRNALTMDERCDVIESLGGSYCTFFYDCLELGELAVPGRDYYDGP